MDKLALGWLPGSASYYLLALGASLAFCYYLLALGAKKRVHLAVSQLMECGIDLLVLEYPDIPQHPSTGWRMRACACRCRMAHGISGNLKVNYY